MARRTAHVTERPGRVADYYKPQEIVTGGKAMRTLFVLNDPSYGTERCYNALRLASALVKQDNVHVTVFLMGDAVLCAKAGQETPQGYYNLERMLKPIAHKGEVILCGTCMNARGMKDEEVTEGARRGTMNELAALTTEADKILIF